VLVEKPLAASPAGLDEMLERGADRLMVGYNLRLHEPIERLMGLVHAGRAGRVLAARLWFGSYLPAWRPDVDYRNTYSARRALGGGILSDAIHEVDLLLWLLGGEFDILGAFLGRTSDLEIDVEDTARALLSHSSGAIVDLSLDMVSRRYRRGIEVVGSDATIRFDWSTAELTIESESELVREQIDSPVLVSYERQAVRFLEWLAGAKPPTVDGPTGAASVQLADRIRTAAAG
jgi:predicted dehydrogenase